MNLWQPMNDRILVQKIEEPHKSRIVMPDAHWRQQAGHRNIADVHLGKVLAVGPGKYMPGYWFQDGVWIPDENGIQHKYETEWQWIPGGREPLQVKEGELVTFGRFTDWAEGGMVMIQEADIMFKPQAPLTIGIDKFTHNEVGIERGKGSIEAMFD
jgi:co-chaperonin GroES (HSP10)